MNVSAELIKSLENMLTTDQFKEFKHAVRLENNPQAALLDAWVVSPQCHVFLERLAERADEHGFVTNASVLDVLTSNPGLLYACQCEVAGDYRWFVGNKAELVRFCHCKVVREEPRMMAARERTWYGDWRENIVQAFTQGLCALGILARTDYVKNCDKGARRCYKILN